MKLPSRFVEVLYLSFVLLIFLDSLECRKLWSNFNHHSATYYLSKLILSSTESGKTRTGESLAVEFELVNHMDLCGNLWKKIVIDDDILKKDNDNRLLNFTKSMSIVNDQFQISFMERIIDQFNISDLEKYITQKYTLLKEINVFLLGKQSKTFLNLSSLLKLMSRLHTERKERKNIDCDSRMSIHQRLYHVYNCISINVLAGFSMIIDAYGHVGKIRRESFDQEIAETKKNLKAILLRISKVSHNALRNTSRNIHRCDPVTYIKGVNYIQLESFIHATVIGLDYLQNPHQCAQGSCQRISRLRSPHELKNNIFRCNGYLHDCNHSSIVKTCFPEHRNNDRRYLAFQNFDGSTIGPWNETCAPENVYDYTWVTDTEIYREFIEPGGFNFDIRRQYHCEICTCFCHNTNQSGSIRKFSLQQVHSKYQQGVVTGIKFNVDHGVIVLDVRVGIIINGVVDPKKQGWNSQFVVKSNPDASSVNETNVNGKHPYETFTLSYQSRKMILDDVETPPGTYIQGVSFHNCGDGISLALLATKVDEEGRLLPATAKWYTNCENCNDHFARKEFELPKNANIPTKFSGNSFVKNVTNSYIKFQVTDWLADASQTIIPFFDIQEVITDPPVPLSSISLYYKTRENSGGFIGFQLSTYNFSMSEGILSKEIARMSSSWMNRLALSFYTTLTSISRHIDLKPSNIET